MPSPSAIAPAPRAAPAAPLIIECDARPVPPRPIHVSLALGGTDFGRSGIGTYVRELLPPLIARLSAEGGNLTAFGHHRELAAFADALAGARTRAVPLVPTMPGLNAAWHLVRAAHCARRCGADVLLLPAANRRITATRLLPTVAVVHDLAQLRVDRKYDRLRMAYFRHILLRAFRQPDRLVAVSRATCRDLERTLGLPPERLRVVYNGVNTARFRALQPSSPGVAEARRSAGLDGRPYLLYPARLEHPGKNHQRLVQAFARSGLASTHVLALSGADWGARPLIEAAIREAGIGESVVLLGYVAADRLPALVNGADAILMLGLHEGFGLPALEALSAGRPVCVANTGALPEVVGSLGAPCDPLDVAAIAEALVRVVRDDAIRERCRKEGPGWAARFTWERTASELLEICREAVDAPR